MGTPARARCRARVPTLFAAMNLISPLPELSTDRRTFIKAGALLAAGIGLPFASGAEPKAKKGKAAEEPYVRPTPSTDLRVACIGIGGKGRGDVMDLANYAHIVAFADVDFGAGSRAAQTLRHFPEVPRFTDYRVMFEKMGSQFDAVTISTPDHAHYPPAMLAMMHGKHVFVQKPMANTIWECRQMMLAARKYKIVTQMGIQGHTFEGQRLLKEWLEAGAIGDVHTVRYWTNRPIWPQGASLAWAPAEQPADLNWDVWQGTVATERPFSRDLHPFKWRGAWDYGCGALGDIGCHLFDAAFWALDLDVPSSVETVATTPFDDNVAPTQSVIRYRFNTARGRRLAKPVEFLWSDGSLLPAKPVELGETRTLDPQFGQLIYGSKGQIYSPGGYCETLRLIPESDMQAFASRRPAKKYPRVQGGPIKEWIDAILNRTQPGANFEYSAKLTEVVLLGNLAIRLGRPIEWDSKNMKVKGIPQADALIKREYRKGWDLPVVAA
jgi:predicted dehydrogenase